MDTGSTVLVGAVLAVTVPEMPLMAERFQGRR